MDLLVKYALSFVGTPYVYGGTSPIIGWDCSEFCLELLKSVGMGPKGDANAKMIHSYLTIMGLKSEKKQGAFIFYGKSTDDISHIAFMIDDNRVIEMGGGDRFTTSPEKANAIRAYCRIRPITHRTDIFDVIMPNYPKWVLK